MLLRNKTRLVVLPSLPVGVGRVVVVGPLVHDHINVGLVERGGVALVANLLGHLG